MSTASPIRAQQSGFSLIELMISMVLGLVLTFGVITFFQDSLSTSRSTISQGQLQEVALMALNTIKKDVRMAGFRGECVPQQSLPEENSAISDFYPVAGIEINGANSDLLRLYTADIQEDELYLWSYNRGSKNLKVCANKPGDGSSCIPAEFETDDLMLVSDCEKWTVFYPNKASTQAKPELLISPALNPDGTTTPSLDELWLPGSDTNTNNPATLQAGQPKGIIYRIGSGNDAGSTVYQVVQDTNPAHQVNSSLQLNQLLRNGEPLLYGVEGLQVLYGDQNGNLIKYREGCTGLQAQSVHACAQALQNSTHLKISLIMQSDQRLGSGQAQTFQVADLDNNGRYQSINDGRMRQVYSTTIKIRNRQ